MYGMNKTSMAPVLMRFTVSWEKQSLRKEPFNYVIDSCDNRSPKVLQVVMGAEAADKISQEAHPGGSDIKDT